jgi:cob(I)alamin adenosyltransferase
MKIYTKSGDKGETSLLGGKRVKKYNLRIHAYGTCDELNAWIGLLRDQKIHEDYQVFLINIQERIFTIGSHLASLNEEELKKNLPKINEDDILDIENQIDELENVLPNMKNFILPGGHQIVSYCHLARTVCRRCERYIIELADADYVDPNIIKFFNRLSDYLFVLSRKVSMDTGSKESPWITK